MTEILAARKVFLEQLRLERVQSNLQRGIPLQRSKKLYEISSMIENGDEDVTIDCEQCSGMIKKEFEGKWKCKDISTHAVINDALARVEGIGLDVSQQELIEAAEAIKKDTRLDGDWLCVKSIRMVVHSCGPAVTQLVNRLSQSRRFFSENVIKGWCKAKKRGAIRASQVRALLPLPSLLSLIDVVVARRLLPVVDAFAAGVDASYLECAKKSRQPLDIVFPLALHIEKSLDQHSQGCVAQADIRAFYDNVQPLLVFEWLNRHGADGGTAACFLRLHCLPPIEMSVRETVVVIGRRSRGVLTGTRSAGIAGRIPLLDVSSQRSHVWSQWAAKYGSSTLACGSFVDNLFTAAHSVSEAVAILSDAELHLNSRWRLDFKEDSKQVLPAHGYDDDDLFHTDLVGWELVSQMPCLGHSLSSDAGIGTEFDNITGKMWAAFFANCKPSIGAVTLRKRLQLLNSFVVPIASFRWSRWPFSVGYAKQIDQTQVHMVSILMDLPPVEGEGAEDFFRRRNLQAGRLAAQTGRWSELWAMSVRNWANHVDRGHDEAAWSTQIYNTRSREWLAAQRLLHVRGSHASRTRTRVLHGKVHRRYFEGVERANSIPFPQRVCKSVIARLQHGQ